jgi:hypothetical protein
MNNLPIKQEWLDAGFNVPKELCQPDKTVSAETAQLLKWYSVGRLYLCDNGRLGLNGHEFHCGECFEIFRPIYDTPVGRWVEVRLEHSSDWYLVGDARQGHELLGITARRST